MFRTTLKATLLSGLLLGVLLLAASPARADAIGTLSLTDCGGGGGCPAATYSFNITSTQATLTIHIDGPVNSQNNHILAVNLGFAPSGAISNLDLIAAPGGVAGWAESTGSIGNSGCGSNNGAFVCAQATSPGFLIVQGGTYVWTWTYDPIAQSQIADANNVHIGANYDPHNGWIVSQTIARTPEPGMLSLLAFGLVGLLGGARKLRRS